MTKRKALSLRLVAAAAVAALAAILAGTASAGNGAATSGRYAPSSCPSFTTKQVFTPWSDSGWYFLGPAASFEGSLTGWTVKGASIVSGNETYYVNSRTDSHSLSLPKNSTATSPSICVTLDSPDLRLFVKNTGSAATLTVNMTYTNNAGKPSTVTVGTIPVAANANWAPTIPVFFLANISSILASNNQTWVTFQFASSGALQIDDVYVDPLKHH